MADDLLSFGNSLGQPQEPSADILSFGNSIGQATARVHTAGPNPDQAAESLKIGNQLGVPPQTVADDYEGYKKLANDQVFSGVIANSHFLTNYVNSHPLAATISRDDWLQMDEAGKAAAKLSATPVWRQMFEGFKSAFEGSGQEFQDYTQWLNEHPTLFGHPLTHQIAGAFGAALSLSTRTIQGGLQAAATGGAALFGPENEAERARLTRDLMILGQVAAPELTEAGGLSSAGKIRQGLKADIGRISQQIEAEGGYAPHPRDSLAEPFIGSNELPPVGVHHEFDAARASEAKADMDALSEAVKAADATATRERSPELFAGALDQITSGEIGISADAIRDLYGDKPITPDDGLLGWVPGLREQLASALDTGGDIQVPLRDWLARVDPAVQSKLADRIRMRPDGMTGEEAKAPPKYESIEAYHGTGSEVDFGTDFDMNVGQNTSEHGVSFFTTNPEFANVWTESNPAGRERMDAAGGKWSEFLKGVQEKYGFNWQSKAPREVLLEGARIREEWSRAGERPPGGAGPRIIPVKINPGKTRTFDVSQLFGEDENFHAILQEVNTNPDSGAIGKGWAEETPERRQSHWDNQVEDLRQQYASHNEQRQRILKETADQEGGPIDIGPWQVPTSSNAIAAVIQIAKKEGLDTARITNLSEGGEQIIVLNKKSIRPRYATDAAVDAVREGAGIKDIVEPPKAAVPPAGPEPTLAQPFATNAPGLTKTQTTRYQKLIEARQAEDAKAAQARILTEQRRHQTTEWKANREVMRREVAEQTLGAPQTRLFDHLSEGRIRINPDSLPDDLRAALPKAWVAKAGLTLERIGDLFEVKDPLDLVRRTVEIEAARETAAMKPRPFVNRMINAEADRRMEAKYGNLKQNIIDEARDQVLSEVQEDLLHEQTLRLGTEAGLEYPLKKDEIKAAMKEDFAKLGQKSQSASRYLADAGRAGRAMEDAHLKGDIAEAFRQSQRQQLAFMYAKEAREFEKERARGGKLIEKYGRREVKGTLPEYTNAIHSIFQQIGLPIGRLPADLAREIEATGGPKTVADFVARKDKEFEIQGVEVPVADFLLDKDFKTKVEDMTVWEYRGLLMSLQTLDHLGRWEAKTIYEGKVADRKDWIKDAIRQLRDKFGVQPQHLNDSKLKTLRKEVTAGWFHSLETVFARFDGRDPDGMFTQMFIYPGAEAMNYKNRLQREYSRKFRELGGIENAGKAVNHDFIDSRTGEPFLDMKRRNLEAIVANIGNKYNLDRMTYTLGAGTFDPKGKWLPDTTRLLKWIEDNTTVEDINRAQARGNLFAELKRQSDTVYRGLYGVAPEDIPLAPFTLHGKTFDGWYHPVIQDTNRRIQEHHAVSDTLTKPTTFWPSPQNGYTKRRTGAFENLSLNPQMIPVKFDQVIHDITMREFVNNAAKVINDKAFRDGVQLTYGGEYHDLMKNWLANVAGNSSYNESAIKLGTWASNQFRQNVISTYIAFGLGTIMKHGPTAFVMSSHEIGLKGMPSFIKNSFKLLPQIVDSELFGSAVYRLFGGDPALGDRLWDFIWNNSEEIQRRDRNWMDTFSGADQVLYGKANLRNRIMQWGAKGVALSDMVSAAPLWLAKYEDAMASHGVHGDAINEANFSVRRAHGSTAATSVPVIASQGGAIAPWFTSLYGFFGANMQRKIELLHDISDTYKLGRKGEISAATKNLPGITATVMAQVIWPAMVEEWVSGQFTDDRRGFLAKSASLLLGGLANSIIGVRDLAWGILHGRDPKATLLDSPLGDISALVRDLKKDHPLGRGHAGKLVEDALTTLGDVTGASPKPVARVIRFGIDSAQGVQHPRTPGDYWRGILTGQMKQRIEK